MGLTVSAVPGSTWDRRSPTWSMIPQSCPSRTSGERWRLRDIRSNDSIGIALDPKPKAPFLHASSSSRADGPSYRRTLNRSLLLQLINPHPPVVKRLGESFNFLAADHSGEDGLFAWVQSRSGCLVDWNAQVVA